jgi:hypothetical protein
MFLHIWHIVEHPYLGEGGGGGLGAPLYAITLFLAKNDFRFMCTMAALMELS